MKKNEQKIYKQYTGYEWMNDVMSCAEIHGSTGMGFMAWHY